MPETGSLEPFLAALRRKDMAGAASYVAEDVRVSGMTPFPFRGRATWRRYVESFWEAFPDLQTDLIDVHERGDDVHIMERLHGTHRGALRMPPLAPVPATGRRIDVGPNRLSFTLRDGRVVRIRAQMQRWQFLWQIGLWPFILAGLKTPFMMLRR